MEQNFEQAPAFTHTESASTKHGRVFEDLEHFGEDVSISDTERARFVEHLLDALHETGGTYCTDVNEIYRGVSERVLVRRESPERALHAIFDHSPIRVSFKEGFGSEAEGGDPYFNAAAWNGFGDIPGLRNPFVEGFSHAEGVVTVLGFTPNEQVEFHNPQHTPEKMTDPAVAYEKDVSISGNIEPGDIRFIVVRIPTKFIDEQELSVAEYDLFDQGKLPFIFRGVLFNKKQDTSSEMSH
jgi:hypothetical protein